MDNHFMAGFADELTKEAFVLGLAKGLGRGVRGLLGGTKKAVNKKPLSAEAKRKAAATAPKGISQEKYDKMRSRTWTKDSTGEVMYGGIPKHLQRHRIKSYKIDRSGVKTQAGRTRPGRSPKPKGVHADAGFPAGVWKSPRRP